MLIAMASTAEDVENMALNAFQSCVVQNRLPARFELARVSAIDF